MNLLTDWKTHSSNAIEYKFTTPDSPKIGDMSSDLFGETLFTTAGHSSIRVQRQSESNEAAKPYEQDLKTRLSDTFSEILHDESPEIDSQPSSEVLPQPPQHETLPAITETPSLTYSTSPTLITSSNSIPVQQFRFKPIASDPDSDSIKRLEANGSMLEAEDCKSECITSYFATPKNIDKIRMQERTREIFTSPFNPKKVYLEAPVPISSPAVQSLLTPELREALSRFGARNLPKKKARLLMLEIQRELRKGLSRNSLGTPLSKSSTRASHDLCAASHVVKQTMKRSHSKQESPSSSKSARTCAPKQVRFMTITLLIQFAC
ncbi:hypothetical protein Ciccas_004832 [Cichlidogyrus casuarinus]|uniref:Uncharacterized protein n=1 Tax=Cichlidogyrus casuarinus TaxID=1844966 RepID=A0ABD2QAD9_9PLAT